MKKIYKIALSADPENVSNGKFTSTAFTVTELGNFVGESTGWSINKSFIREYLLPETGHKIDLQDKKIYRYPKLTLPTQKVDLLKEKYNLKVTRKINDADYRVVSTKFLESQFDMSWDTSHEFPIVFKFFKHLVDKQYLSESGYTRVKEIVEGLPKDCRIIIKKPWHYNTQTRLQLTEFIFPDDKGRLVYIKKEMVAEIDSIIEHTDKIIFDTDVSDIIDQDLAIINDDQFKNIKEMLTSADVGTRSLAVEMLANCNISKSYNVVSYLYYWYYEWFKDSSNWQSVNIKTFRKRMKKYEGGISEGIFSYNRYIQFLIEDGKLTTFVLNKTRERLYNNILGSIIGDSSDVFKMPIDCLNIKEEMQQHIDE